MKIKLKTSMIIEGKEIAACEIININKSNLDKWLKKGWGEIIKKEVKIKKETKEFKIDKQTKNETNKD